MSTAVKASGRVKGVLTVDCSATTHSGCDVSTGNLKSVCYNEAA